MYSFKHSFIFSLMSGSIIPSFCSLLVLRMQFDLPALASPCFWRSSAGMSSKVWFVSTISLYHSIISLCFIVPGLVRL